MQTALLYRGALVANTALLVGELLQSTLSALLVGELLQSTLSALLVGELLQSTLSALLVGELSLIQLSAVSTLLVGELGLGPRLEKKLVVAHDIRRDLASLQIHLDAHIPTENVVWDQD